jgi:hypothetical protein
MQMERIDVREFNPAYGFSWGPVRIHRTAHIDGRGWIITIWTDSKELEVYVTEKGRNIRVWRDGKELT